jgi:hypothetical protein
MGMAYSQRLPHRIHYNIWVGEYYKKNTAQIDEREIYPNPEVTENAWLKVRVR